MHVSLLNSGTVIGSVMGPMPKMILLGLNIRVFFLECWDRLLFLLDFHLKGYILEAAGSQLMSMFGKTAWNRVCTEKLEMRRRNCILDTIDAVLG